jgi:hypothetical protein
MYDRENQPAMTVLRPVMVVRQIYLQNREHPKPLLVSQLYPQQRAERSEKTGVWGRIPQEVR